MGYVGFVQKGMDVAKAALKAVLNLKLDSDACAKDLAKVSEAAGKTINADTIDAIANDIQDKGYLYDGDTSSTPWTVADFGPSAKGGNNWTVGNEFSTTSATALSQATGAAIWVKTAAWQYYGGDQAGGTILHEIVHKFGLNDGQMAGALNVNLNTVLSTAALSKKFMDDCVKQQ